MRLKRIGGIATNGVGTMSGKSASNTSLNGGIILLAISCINIGYGLCALVNGLANAALPASVGAMFAALSTILIAKGVKSLADGNSA